MRQIFLRTSSENRGPQIRPTILASLCGTELGQVAHHGGDPVPVLKLKNHDHIYEPISAGGRLTGYQVKIRRKGFPDFTATFDDLEAAKAAVRRVLNDHDDGVRRDRLLAARVTFGDVLDREIAKREKDSCTIKGKESELYRLKAFRRNERALCQTALSALGYDEFDDWKERRLEELAAGTVLRELRLLRPILNDAVPRYHLVVSPLHYVKNPWSTTSASRASAWERRSSCSQRCGAHRTHGWRPAPSSLSRPLPGGARCSRPSGSTMIRRSGRSGCRWQKTERGGSCS
ncbi:hypothetical protein GGR24_002784 [Hansschlegelia beijingensis]|uniref:Uncharacterized protein n=1 Tax=Hansschlegelia beijingensis TaxID=1133344 RepID=A0A7W6D163_9HYPH|nr:hypothetical protein [Hansschlegelia beijingensis]